MTTIYTILFVFLVIAVFIDIFLLSSRHKEINYKKGLIITFFWISLSLIFSLYIAYKYGYTDFVKYISAYVLEWSLSLDNIFIFILIFGVVKVHPKDIRNALLVGILMAVIFRLLFISIGVELIERFHWILYIFGAILIYMGIKMFFKKDASKGNPTEPFIIRFFKKHMRLIHKYRPGTYVVRVEKKWYFTPLMFAIVLLGVTDVMFAVDSIPTVISLIRKNVKGPFSDIDQLIIYSSNIFAILGLRTLYFLLKKSMQELLYLHKSISLLLIFIGSKMLLELLHIYISIYVSFIIMITILLIGTLLSFLDNKKIDNGIYPK